MFTDESIERTDRQRWWQLYDRLLLDAWSAVESDGWVYWQEMTGNQAQPGLYQPRFEYFARRVMDHSGGQELWTRDQGWSGQEWHGY